MRMAKNTEPNCFEEPRLERTQTMNEYIFFDVGLRDKFVEYAKTLGVECELRDDNMGIIAAVPEDIADDLDDSLEERYDELQEEQSDLLTLSDGGLKKLAGFQLVLPDGQTSTVALQPEMAKRLLACFNFDEIQVLFDAVARSALDPKNRPLCEILRAEKL
jgi:hypothetical protein